MASTAALSNPPEPLPQVPGSKLAPFTQTAYADIEFIHELGNPKQDLDGHVWKVRINGEAPFYALKMFRFKSYRYLKETMGGSLTRRLASPRLYIEYMDPFHTECRAYGRLKNENREDLAVRAHGYLFLTPSQEAEVTERSNGFELPPVDADAPDLDGVNAWGRWEEHRGMPVRAIVKDLATYPPFTPGNVNNLWRDMEDLHKLGILVRDVSVGNYLGGKLVDFGHSWTVPHPCLEYIHPDYLREQRHSEPLDLQNAVADYAMANWRVWGDWEEPKELWEYASGKGEGEDRLGTDPRGYDWRRWEDDLEAVDAFLEHELYAGPAFDLEGGEDWEEWCRFRDSV